MTNFIWKQFSLRVTINATTADVFNAWTTQAGLERWFLRSAIFKIPGSEARGVNDAVQAGDTYKWLWFGYDDSTAEEGAILLMNGRNMLAFTFSGGCIVTVTIIEEAGETVCELRQEMPMDNEDDQRHFFIECGKGWTFYLANLKSMLEGGRDLRNKNEKVQHVINS